MTETQRLLNAIRKIVGAYLPAAVRKNDDAAIVKWGLRLADYSTRLAVLASPELEMREAVALAEAEDGGPVYDHILSYDEEHVIFLAAEDKILTAAGKPAGHDGAERGALPLAEHIALAEELNLPRHAAEFRGMIQPGTEQ